MSKGTTHVNNNILKTKMDEMLQHMWQSEFQSVKEEEQTEFTENSDLGGAS